MGVYRPTITSSPVSSIFLSAVISITTLISPLFQGGDRHPDPSAHHDHPRRHHLPEERRQLGRGLFQADDANFHVVWQ